MLLYYWVLGSICGEAFCSEKPGQSPKQIPLKQPRPKLTAGEGNDTISGSNQEQAGAKTEQKGAEGSRREQKRAAERGDKQGRGWGAKASKGFLVSQES